MPCLSDVTKPLREVTQKETKWIWGLNQQAVLEKLKKYSHRHTGFAILQCRGEGNHIVWCITVWIRTCTHAEWRAHGQCPMCPYRYWDSVWSKIEAVSYRVRLWLLEYMSTYNYGHESVNVKMDPCASTRHQVNCKGCCSDYKSSLWRWTTRRGRMRSLLAL